MVKFSIYLNRRVFLMSNLHYIVHIERKVRLWTDYNRNDDISLLSAHWSWFDRADAQADLGFSCLHKGTQPIST